MSIHRTEVTVPITRDGRTFEQRRRDMLNDMDHSQSTTTTESSQRRTIVGKPESDTVAQSFSSDSSFGRSRRLVPAFNDDWDSEVNSWVEGSRRRWDNDMERIRSDMMSLEPTSRFDSDPWGDRHSMHPFHGSHDSSSLMAKMERDMDMMRQQSPFGSSRPTDRGGGSFQSSSSSRITSSSTTSRSGNSGVPITHTNVEESVKRSQTVDGVTTGTSSHSASSDTTKGHNEHSSLRSNTPGALIQSSNTMGVGPDFLKDAYEIGPDGQVHFKVRFDAKDFAAEDIKVTTVDKQLTVHAKRSIQSDTGTGTREFSRTVDLPVSIDHANFQCNLTEDGVLILDAPVNAPEYQAITFDKDNQIGIRPQSESQVQTTKSQSNRVLTSIGHTGSSILQEGAAGRRIHLEVPIDSEYTADELCVRTDSKRIIVSGKKSISTGQAGGGVMLPRNFSKSFEVPETFDLMLVTAQMVGNTLIIEAPLKRNT